MGYFPVSLQLADKSCLVVGGGEVAARKAASLAACGALLTVISPALCPELAREAEAGRLAWIAREYRPGDLSGAFLVIAATDDPAVQERIFQEAEEHNLLLNVADVPKWCNVILPAVVRRGELTVAISTGGRSPALARSLRRRLEREFGREYEVLLELLGALRGLILARGDDHQVNREIFHQLVEPDLAAWIRQGEWELLRNHIARILPEPEALLRVDEVSRHYLGQEG